MALYSFASGPLAANCYVLTSGETRECVVIDPGQQAAEQLAMLVARHGLRPVVALVTHGHFDHVGSLAEVCDEYHMGAYIGAADEYMLTDQWSALSRDLAVSVREILGHEHGFEHLRPATVTPLEAERMVLTLAGYEIDAIAIPGHTPGSYAYRVRHSSEQLLFTGDTLFAGSIGRTDLPGGSSKQILTSIRDQVLTLPDETTVLPGHGAATTIGQERATNPFLAGLSG